MKGRNSFLRFFSARNLWITAAVLLVLTLITGGIIVGLYARQATASDVSDKAAVAAAGNVSVYEHKAEISINTDDIANGIYVLNTAEKVTSNEYPVIVPGTEIPKDPFIEFAGTNDVPYYLYLEVVESFPRNAAGELTDIKYTVTPGIWQKTDAFEARHNGTVYVFSDGKTNPQPKTIEPHRTDSITNIIRDNRLYVSEDFKDITDPAKNSQPYRMDFYVYLVQKD